MFSLVHIELWDNTLIELDAFKMLALAREEWGVGPMPKKIGTNFGNANILKTPVVETPPFAACVIVPIKQWV